METNGLIYSGQRTNGPTHLHSKILHTFFYATIDPWTWWSGPTDRKQIKIITILTQSPDQSWWNKANDASSWLMKWLYDCMIHDILSLVSSSFDRLVGNGRFSLNFRKDWQTDYLIEMQGCILRYTRAFLWPSLGSLWFLLFLKNASRTDGRTDGQTCMKRCEGASKNLHEKNMHFVVFKENVTNGRTDGLADGQTRI